MHYLKVKYRNGYSTSVWKWITSGSWREDFRNNEQGSQKCA